MMYKKRKIIELKKKLYRQQVRGDEMHRHTGQHD